MPSGDTNVFLEVAVSRVPDRHDAKGQDDHGQWRVRSEDKEINRAQDAVVLIAGDAVIPTAGSRGCSGRRGGGFFVHTAGAKNGAGRAFQHE